MDNKLELPENLVDQQVNQNDIIDMMVEENIDKIEVRLEELKTEKAELKKSKSKTDLTKIVHQHILDEYQQEIKKAKSVFGSKLKPSILIYFHDSVFEAKISDIKTCGTRKVLILFSEKQIKPTDNGWHKNYVTDIIKESSFIINVGEINIEEINGVKEYQENLDNFNKELYNIDDEIRSLKDQIYEIRNNKNKFKAKLTRSILEGSEEGKKLITNLQKMMETKSLNEKN
jgi:hypothetical protein